MCTRRCPLAGVIYSVTPNCKYVHMCFIVVFAPPDLPPRRDTRAGPLGKAAEQEGRAAQLGGCGDAASCVRL